MEMRRCNRGHYYDASIHMSCPYCSNTADSEMTVPMGVSPYAQSPVESTIPMQYGSVDVTMPIGMGATVAMDDDDGRTVAILTTESGIEPVVGWSVCLTGKNKGKEYRLHSDNNYVGRSEKMDVCIKNDDTISRENQAIFTYDVDGKCFYLSPGSGRSVIKLNGKPIFQTAELSAYDRVILGKTEFLFVPLCGEEFAWEEE